MWFCRTMRDTCETVTFTTGMLCKYWCTSVVIYAYLCFWARTSKREKAHPFCARVKRIHQRGKRFVLVHYNALWTFVIKIITQSAPEPAPFRGPTQSAPEPAPLQNPLQSPHRSRTRSRARTAPEPAPGARSGPGRPQSPLRSLSPFHPPDLSLLSTWLVVCCWCHVLPCLLSVPSHLVS